MNTLFLLAGPLLFAANLVMIEVGERIGRATRAAAGESSVAVGSVNTTVLSLMSLVLAFTFSSAAARLSASRETILAEVNSVASTWTLIDVAEPETRPRLRALVRDYLDARIRAYDALPNRREYDRQVKVGQDLYARISSEALLGTTPTSNRMLLLNAVSSVGDAAAARTMSLETHFPLIVFVFLFGLVLLGSILVGTTLRGPGRQWFFRVTLAAVLAAVVFAIMDMEFPRLGVPLLRQADAMLVGLRASMNQQ